MQNGNDPNLRVRRCGLEWYGSLRSHYLPFTAANLRNSLHKFHLRSSYHLSRIHCNLTMELSRPQLDTQESISSIQDLSDLFDQKKGIQEPALGYLTSSLRSFVDDGDDFPEDLLDEWQDSFIGNVADDDADFNGSIRYLFTSVNDLLLSKATFTLSECTSLETEMMRLKKLQRQKNKQVISKPGFDPLSLGDHHPVASRASDDAVVQKQKEKLANILKDAVGGTEGKCFLPTNLRTARRPPKPKSKKTLKMLPLNPDRFQVEAYDSAPKSPPKRGGAPDSVRKGLDPVSPLTPAGSVDGFPTIQRWDSEIRSPVKTTPNAPTSLIKRTQSPSVSAVSLQLSSIPILDSDDDDVSSTSSCQQAMVSTVLENDAAPKQPTRIPSRRQLVIRT